MQAICTSFKSGEGTDTYEGLIPTCSKNPEIE